MSEMGMQFEPSLTRPDARSNRCFLDARVSREGVGKRCGCGKEVRWMRSENVLQSCGRKYEKESSQRSRKQTLATLICGGQEQDKSLG